MWNAAFVETPFIGLVYATIIGEGCIRLSASLFVGAWHGNVHLAGVLVGMGAALFVFLCAWAAWWASAAMRHAWFAAILAAGASLGFAIVQAKDAIQ